MHMSMELQGEGTLQQQVGNGISYFIFKKKLLY